MIKCKYNFKSCNKKIDCFKGEIDRANYVKVDVVCPCGRLLLTRSSNADSGSTTRGSKMCPACRRNVEWSVRGAYSYTNYK